MPACILIDEHTNLIRLLGTWTAQRGVNEIGVMGRAVCGILRADGTVLVYPLHLNACDIGVVFFRQHIVQADQARQGDGQHGAVCDELGLGTNSVGHRDMFLRHGLLRQVNNIRDNTDGGSAEGAHGAVFCMAFGQLAGLALGKQHREADTACV